MSALLEALRERVLLCDGAMGSRVQALDLDVGRDFQGHENCTEILNLARPDLVIGIHRGYLAAGADMVETNSFGGSPVTLGEFGLQDHAHEINRRAAELAREAVEGFVKGDGRPRFVLGSVGPGTRLPSLGHVDYDTLEAALTVQCAGLIDGGVDAFLIETCQDPLQIKAAVNAAKAARAAAGRDDLPVMVQVTVETTGTLLVGTDIAAAATVVRALDVPVIGLNCATGPQEMAAQVRWLAESWEGPVSVQPNAGLPELVDGRPRYPLQPEELARWLERFLVEDGINIVGGCCGTTEAHIAALDAMLRRLAPRGHRPAPRPRAAVWTPGVASLYGHVAYRQENAFFSIGERCNANGSRRFRELQERRDWDGCVAMGVQQAKDGSHAVDVCTAFVGRDEVGEMRAVVARMRGAVSAPLVIDSTELPVLEAALGLYGGKPIINSVNFEDGEEPAAKRLRLARRFGAAVIALTIDEQGMAKEAVRKVEIARRLHDFACGRHGLPPEDLLIDPLTFTICTGNNDDRRLGLWTLEAIEAITRELPRCQIVLGLSNISFGLDPAARHVLNSVFLDHALRRGLTAAIVHASRIVPLHKIPEAEVKAAEDLIFDRRESGDPLQAFIGLFAGRSAAAAPKRERAADVGTRLKNRIIDGDRQGLEDDLAEALKTMAPLDIINTHLLDGMKVVGELFGAGRMQLPFVLQSAETMKAAVRYLEPFMERAAGQDKGTIVLATVKGDVHDIGKNLVDVILTNNGYRVVNLGIKQPLEAILAAAEEHKADAVGMSGLLVKSTVVMRENLERMSRQQVRLPVILGGAALTRAYVEEDCAKAYACGRVAYARDAFDGLSLMEKVVSGRFDEHLAATRARRGNGEAARPRRPGEPRSAAQRPVEAEERRLRREQLARGVAVPVPPFWGPMTISRVPVDALVPYLNERMLYQFHWGFRKDGRSLEAYMAWARRELRPVLRRLIDVCKQQDILRPQAVYGYWPANAEGDSLVLYDPVDRDRAVARFDLPRQAREGGLCIADFVRDAASGERDVVALQVVTVGQNASDTAREWFAEDRYRDYLYLHGLGVEMAEALAEYVHKRIRAELGFGHEDARDKDRLLQQGYRGSRYSFGYPACPRLEDQAQILALLDAGRIGVTLSDEFQLHPEQSTSALVLHHPQARYFSV
ncbi:MAG: methionine synthase [Rhodospirillaceae bacterium]|nr:methionine synthase [Rhodospirillaceae bacterium]